MKKVELLAPAGNIEKLKFALEYGADAVYIGYPGLSLRSYAEKFSLDEIKDAASYVRNKGARLYVALNIFAHNSSLNDIKKAVRYLKKIQADGLIVSDPGIVFLIKEIWPDAKIHLSTQSNTTNKASVKFWQNNGVSRVCLARELTLEDVKEICLSNSLEIEVFVHGAMCISYSGRCYLSKYMINREANLGECGHSCRWSYRLEEEKRPGQYMPIEQDEHGTYILNSKDLCLARHIPSLIDAGVSAFKIEGRMKSIHYISIVTSVYRRIIDTYREKGKDFIFNEKWTDDLRSIGNRHYTEGFVTNNMADETEHTLNSKQSRSHEFLGYIFEKIPQEGNGFLYKLKVRNQIKKADKIEFYQPGGKIDFQPIGSIFSARNNGELELANPNEEIMMNSRFDLPLMTLIRRPLQESI
jgi:putative protease